MIYNVDLKKAKGPIEIEIFFTLISIIFLLLFGGIFISTILEKNSLDAEVKATNIVWEEHYDSEDGSITYSPNYEYVVDGKVYVCNSSTSSSTKSGDGTVYYNSENPSKCMTDFENDTNFFLAIFLFIPVIGIVIGGSKIKKSISKIKIVKELAKSGVLVKNLPYQLVDSNIYVNNFPLKYISATYKFPDGVFRELRSEVLKRNVLSDADGMCDLLYDPNNYNNYFIDFDITPTGIGSPNIIYYNQTEQGNVINNTFDNNVNNNYPHPDSNEYNPNNKF